MIEIKKSETADTRTCDYTKVTIDQLKKSSESHIHDVREGFLFFIEELRIAAYLHDKTKITRLESFYNDFITGFKTTTWYEMHKKQERHHIDSPDGIPEDVNIVDLLEHIIDCVMAGMARKGEVFPINLPNELLQKIVSNTVYLLKRKIVVSEI